MNQRPARGKVAKAQMRVFLLQHTRELADGTDDVKLIGVYSSEPLGRAAIATLSLLPGFREHPAGFELTPYELDATHWADGFVSSGDYFF
jgi:hypothetical protein